MEYEVGLRRQNVEHVQPGSRARDIPEMQAQPQVTHHKPKPYYFSCDSDIKPVKIHFDTYHIHKFLFFTLKCS